MKEKPKGLVLDMDEFIDLGNGHYFHRDAAALRWLTVNLGWSMQMWEPVGRSRKKHLRGKTPVEIVKIVTVLVARANDQTRCNNPCKSLYFCERKRGHKGKHRENGLSWD